jgi:hypothetical protein
MLRRVQYRECGGEELRRTGEFDPPVVTWETKVIYVYSYSQILGEGGESQSAVYAQSCMVNPPSKNQLQRAPISFTRSKVQWFMPMQEAF